ncbi:MAG: DNA polymerase III subunit delta [Oscillospiraceae bacterium]|nr:DNA polymerase III subunit delta [Oscillospiraceae bacterium]
MALKELKTQLKEEKPAACYVFFGEESYLREYYTRQLIAAVYGDDDSELTILRGRGLTMDELLDAVESISMLHKHKLVIVKDLDFSKPPANLKEALETLAIPEDVTLLFTCTSPDYKPDKRTKSYKNIIQIANVVEFERQKEADLVPWIVRRFGTYGKQIANSEANYLLFQCGTLMGNLAQEVDKITSFSDNAIISKLDIDAVALPVVETVVFALTNELTDGRYDRAAATLNDLLQAREEPIMLLGLLGKQLRGLYAAKLAMNAGQGSRVVMDMMGYRNEYPAKKLLDAARRLSLEWCRQAMIMACEYDKKLKTSSVDKQDALPLLLAELAMNKHE